MPGSLTDIHIHSYVGVLFLIGSLAVQAGFKSAMSQRMNCQSSCLYFPSAGITGVCHCILSMQSWGNHTPSPSSDFSELLIVGHRKWLLWQTCCLPQLECFSTVTAVIKGVFHEDGKMSLVKFPFDKQISIAYWK